MPDDQFASLPTTLNSPARNCSAITPDDDDAIDPPTRAIIVGDDGDLVCRFVGDDADVTLTLSAGLYPFMLKAVRDTNTTVTKIHGLR